MTAELPAGVRRLFTEGFQIADVAGPLASFDAETPGPAVAAAMDRDGLAVVGVRSGGRVAGYVGRDGLGAGPCGDARREFSAGALLPGSAPLAAAVRVLAGEPLAFVTAFGEVAGVVAREDFEEPAARMWLFGMVTLVELRYTRLIAELCPGDAWREYLSEGRLRKAEELKAERTRRHRPVGLLECLQLSDKGQIVARNEEIRGRTVFASRKQVEEAIRLLEGLRNDLAHAQEVVAANWDAIVQLTGHLDRALDAGGRQAGTT
jgi:hypothetical protein